MGIHRVVENFRRDLLSGKVNSPVDQSLNALSTLAYVSIVSVAQIKQNIQPQSLKQGPHEEPVQYRP